MRPGSAHLALLPANKSSISSSGSSSSSPNASSTLRPHVTTLLSSVAKNISHVQPHSSIGWVIASAVVLCVALLALFNEIYFPTVPWSELIQRYQESLGVESLVYMKKGRTGELRSKLLRNGRGELKSPEPSSESTSAPTSSRDGSSTANAAQPMPNSIPAETNPTADAGSPWRWQYYSVALFGILGSDLYMGMHGIFFNGEAQQKVCCRAFSLGGSMLIPLSATPMMFIPLSAL